MSTESSEDFSRSQSPVSVTDQAPVQASNSAPPRSKARTTSPSNHQKACSRCQKLRDVLVRCQISGDDQWLFVCPGKCWTEVSGGVIDGDGKEGHEGYRYGGMWKNKRAGVSAKKKSKKKTKQLGTSSAEADTRGEPYSQATEGIVKVWQSGAEQAEEHEQQYTRNDKVFWHGKTWSCRRTHVGSGQKNEQEPGVGYRFWKEVN